MSEVIGFLGLACGVMSLAILAVFVLRAPVRRRFGAESAYHLWLLAPISMLALVLPARTVSRPVEPMAPEAMMQGSAPVTQPLDSALTAAERLPQALNAPLAEIAPDVVDFGPWLVLLWGLGAALTFAGFVVQTWRVHIAYRAVRLKGPGAVYQAASAETGPAVIGLVRPKIILPLGFEQRYDATQQALIMAHERAHLRHGDTRVNALVCLFVSVFWFNPLSYLAARVLRQDQEMARDAQVLLAHPGQEAAYSRALLAAHQHAPSFLPTGCAWTSRHPLVERVSALSNIPKNRAGRRLGRAVLLSVLTLGATGAWAVQPAQTLTVLSAFELFPVVEPHGPAQIFEASSLVIRHDGPVNLIFEARDSVALQGRPGLDLAMTTEADRIWIGPVNTPPCTAVSTQTTAADLTVRLPETLRLTLAGATRARIMGETKTGLYVSECAHAELGVLTAPAQIAAADQSRVTIERLSRDSDIVLADASTLELDEATARLTLDQIGASQSQIVTVSGPIAATVAGASSLAIDRIQTNRADLLAVGASRVDLPSGAIEALGLRVLGASAAHIAARTRTASVSAAGDVDITLDAVEAWSVTSVPDEEGQLLINGEPHAP